MMLAHILISEPMYFKENSVMVLTIENTRQYREMVTDLIQQSEGEEGKFVLSEDNEPLNPSKYLHIVQDFIHLDIEERRFTNRLQSYLLQIAQQELGEQAQEITDLVESFLQQLSVASEYDMVYEVGERLTQIIKMAGFKVNMKNESAIENLIEHLSVYNGLMKNQCNVLIGAKSWFCREELMQLYKMAFYRKWKLLLIENHQQGPPIPGEEHYIIDKDLCELRLDLNGETM